MELSINALAERAEEFSSSLALARHRQLAGLGARAPLTKLVADFQPLLRGDTFLQVQQAAANTRTDAQTRASLQRLLGFLAWAHPLDAAAPALDGCAAELDRELSSSMRTMPLWEAIHRLPADPERERRHALERDLSQALWDRQAAWARVIDANIASSARLGFASMRAQHEALTLIELQPWLDAAQKLLASTDDAYRDLLGYVLKRLDPQLKPQAARWHDVLHGCTAPWMGTLFRDEDLLPAVTRTFEDLGLTLSTLALDTERREGKTPGAHVCAVRVPGDVRVVIGREGGLQACAQLLGGFAEGQLWARAPATAGVLDRRFPDPGAVQGMRTLAAHFALEEGWLKRALHLPSAAAREAARLGAFAALAQLRQAAALLPYTLEVFERGPTRALAEEYEDRLGRALGVGVPRGAFLLGIEGVDPVLLRGASLAVGLAASLRERFNEDYFRNPATGSWFQQVAEGVGVDAARPDAAQLTRASQRLVLLMGT